jgi:hypothetical protein
VTRLCAALPLALLIVSTSGCTAGLATLRLFSAEKAIQEATEKGADVHAPYPFTLAQRHLDKAIEESGESEFKTSLELAKKAKAYAEAAVTLTEGGTRDLGELINDDGQLSDEQAGEGAEDGEDLRDAAEPTPSDKKDEEEGDDFEWEDEE